MAVLPGTERNVPPGEQQEVEAAAAEAQPLRGLKSIHFLLPAGKTFRAPRQQDAAAAALDGSAAGDKPFLPPKIRRLRKAFRAPLHGR